MTEAEPPADDRPAGDRPAGAEQPPSEHPTGPHEHGHSVYEPGEFLDAPADEVISEAEVSLSRRLLNWRTLAGLAFAMVMVFLLFRVVLNVDFGRTWQLVQTANIGLLMAGFAAYYLTFPLRSLRWWLILRRVGTRVPYRNATEILFLSWFVNCLVPAKLGDLYRAYLLRANHGASISRTVGTIFLERITDIVVIFALALAAGFWSFRNRNNPQVDALFLAGFIVASLLVILLVVLRFQGRRVTALLPARVADLWERFHEGSTGAMRPMLLLQVAAITAAVWSLEGVRVYFVIHSLDLPSMDLPALNLGISSSIFVALAASLLTVVPLTPAGMGFVQAGIVGVLALYGVSTEAGTAVAVTDFLLSTLSVIVLGGILYAFSSMVRRAHGANGGSSNMAASPS
ncbi:MAG TPA: lysylphosphatidylglycerol synthase transmembrane domain-containing protein [Candidatus Limnocylindrales bacterium]|nr:lysylphosphatidylglycerol synthase transmembrane domain-containing protein [Candidatus Limnocylindrales bacterium]